MQYWFCSYQPIYSCASAFNGCLCINEYKSGGNSMGTILGLLLLVLLDYMLFKKAGMHFPKWVEKQYADHLEKSKDER
jgi:hypothetical protein